MKRKAFPGYGPEVRENYRAAGHWLRATVFGNDESRKWLGTNKSWKIERAQGEGVGTTGEFLVPPILASAIYDLREQYGAMRRTALVQPMGSDSLSVPRRTGGTVATFMTQNTAAASAQAAYDQVNLVAKKIGALIPLSSELAEDSLANIVDVIANELAWAFASKEDDCAFNGDGSSTYGGMRGISQIVLDGNHAVANVPAVSGHNQFVTLDATDINSLMAGVRASAMPNAAWFASQTAFALTFCRLAAQAGGSLLQWDRVNNIRTPIYLGFPVILCQKLPLSSGSLTGKVMLAFGDMYHGGVLGERRGLTVKRSDDRYLDTDQIGLLGTERFDSVIHDMGDNVNAGSLAALVGA